MKRLRWLLLPVAVALPALLAPAASRANLRPPTVALAPTDEAAVLRDCTARVRLGMTERVGVYTAFMAEGSVFVLLRVFDQENDKRAKLCRYGTDLAFKGVS